MVSDNMLEYMFLRNMVVTLGTDLLGDELDERMRYLDWSTWDERMGVGKEGIFLRADGMWVKSK